MLCHPSTALFVRGMPSIMLSLYQHKLTKIALIGDILLLYFVILSKMCKFSNVNVMKKKCKFLGVKLSFNLVIFSILGKFNTFKITIV